MRTSCSDSVPCSTISSKLCRISFILGVPSSAWIISKNVYTFRRSFCEIRLHVL